MDANYTDLDLRLQRGPGAGERRALTATRSEQGPLSHPPSRGAAALVADTRQPILHGSASHSSKNRLDWNAYPWPRDLWLGHAGLHARWPGRATPPSFLFLPLAVVLVSLGLAFMHAWLVLSCPLRCHITCVLPSGYFEAPAEALLG